MLKTEQGKILLSHSAMRFIMKFNDLLLYICLAVLSSEIAVCQTRQTAKPCKCKIVSEGVAKSEIVCLDSQQLKNRAITSIPEIFPGSSGTTGKIKDKTVVVDIFVDKNGKVVKAAASKGHPFLRPSAVSAARRIEFSPIEIESKPVNMCGSIILKWNPRE